MGLNIVIPVYVVENSNIPIILDQLYVAIESYYFHKNIGTFFIYTNNDLIEKGINHYKRVFYRDVVVVKLDFEKTWEQLNLPINSTRTRKTFIISKMVIPFLHDEDYLLMDWDILTTGYIKPAYIISDKIRLFNPKMYDGITLRQNSVLVGIKPENEMVGRHRWVNSGMVYSPKGKISELIKEYWEKYNSIITQEYRGIYLYDIIGDELLYNLMLIDSHDGIEEMKSYNLNVVLRNFYYDFSDLVSMYDFGNCYPNVLNVHFAGGHVKPFDVIVDENNNLTFKMSIENYAINKKCLRWLFDLEDHRLGSFNYNALIFSIIWQHTRYSIKDKLDPDNDKSISKRYLEFFKRNFLNE